jgi:hypothetical protein
MTFFKAKIIFLLMVSFSKTIQKPSLCFTYDHYDPELLQTILPHVAFVETTVDTITQTANDGSLALHPDIIKQLQEIALSKKIVAHGVGLSIGSYDGYSQQYFQMLEQLIEAVPIYLHSEHLGYSSINGSFLHVMFPTNRNQENLDLICERIQQIQDRIKIPFLLENVARVVPDYHPEFSDAGFINEITRRTGCGFILDVYNLFCDAHNFQCNKESFIEELNLDPVRELHLANGEMFKDRMMDIHSKTISQQVLDFTADILKKANHVEMITFELVAESVPELGYKTIEDELIRLNHFFDLTS